MLEPHFRSKCTIVDHYNDRLTVTTPEITLILFQKPDLRSTIERYLKGDWQFSNNFRSK